MLSPIIFQENKKKKHKAWGKQFKWLHFKQNHLDFKSIKARCVSHLSITTVLCRGLFSLKVYHLITRVRITLAREVSAEFKF